MIERSAYGSWMPLALSSGGSLKAIGVTRTCLIFIAALDTVAGETQMLRQLALGWTLESAGLYCRRVFHRLPQPGPSVPLTSIEPRRLYRQIAEQIRGLISSGEYTTGSRLPPERDLARQLRVSRPSVREALIALEVEGLVEVRVGSGIYIRTPFPGVNSQDSPRVAQQSGPFEILRARRAIEGECAALAAK